MQNINSLPYSCELLNQMQGIISGAIPDEQKKEKLRLIGNKIFEALRAISLNDSNLFWQADALKNATDRTENMDVALVSEITGVMRGMLHSLDPATATPKERPKPSTCAPQMAEVEMFNAFQKARFAFSKESRPHLAVALKHLVNLIEAHGISSQPLSDYDHLYIDPKDKTLVCELIGQAKGNAREIIRTFCALGYMHTGTKEAIQEAYTIVSEIRNEWHRWVALRFLKHAFDRQDSSFRPLTSEEVDFAIQMAGTCLAESSRAFADEIKHERSILPKRLLFETQDAYGRLLGMDVTGQTKMAINEIDRIFVRGLFGKTLFGTVEDCMVIIKENLREFYEGHSELQKHLEPILWTIDNALEIARATEAKRLIPERLDDVQNTKIACLIDTQLQTMEPGSRLLIPTGTTKHSVSLELKKTIDGTFTCLLYNTGGGLELGNHQHQNGFSPLYEKYYPITWTNILPATLSREFFQKICAFSHRLTDMNKFMEVLYAQLGKDDKVAAKSTHAYHPQGLNACAYKSTAVFLHAAMEEILPGLYNKYKHDTTERLIQRFDAAFPELRSKAGNPSDDEVLNTAQLQWLRDMAEKTMKRRKMRESTLRQFSEVFNGSRPLNEVLAMSSMFDMKDEVIIEHFVYYLSKYLTTNGTVSQLYQCLEYPSFAPYNDLLRTQFITASLTGTQSIDEGELLQIMKGIKHLNGHDHRAVLEYVKKSLNLNR